MTEHVEPLDVESLCAAVEAGFHPKPLFFWGHTGKAFAPFGNECFSQWYESPFVVDELCYRTAEHYMMAGKARLFGDEHAAVQIMSCGHPREVKEIGRHVRGFDDDTWEEHRFEIVAAGSFAKFSQNASLKSYLLATGSRVLVEASPTDRVWGIGLAAKDPRARDPKAWQGLNLLGFALMHARAALLAGR